jgi:hypothetical protein
MRFGAQSSTIAAVQLNCINILSTCADTLYWLSLLLHCTAIVTSISLRDCVEFTSRVRDIHIHNIHILQAVCDYNDEPIRCSEHEDVQSER